MWQLNQGDIADDNKKLENYKNKVEQEKQNNLFEIAALTKLRKVTMLMRVDSIEMDVWCIYQIADVGRTIYLCVQCNSQNLISFDCVE